VPTGARLKGDTLKLEVYLNKLKGHKNKMVVKTQVQRE